MDRRTDGESGLKSRVHASKKEQVFRLVDGNSFNVA